jgi:hypothetical protein
MTMEWISRIERGYPTGHQECRTQNEQLVQGIYG